MRLQIRVLGILKNSICIEAKILVFLLPTSQEKHMNSLLYITLYNSLLALAFICLSGRSLKSLVIH